MIENKYSEKELKIIIALFAMKYSQNFFLKLVEGKLLQSEELSGLIDDTILAYNKINGKG